MSQGHNFQKGKLQKTKGQKDKKTKRQKDKKTKRQKDKNTKRQKDTKDKKRALYCDVRAVSYSCDVFAYKNAAHSHLISFLYFSPLFTYTYFTVGGVVMQY